MQGTGLASGACTYYHVKDTTLIQNISLKDLLSNIKTTVELTTYLAAKTTLTNMQRLSLHLQTLLFSS